MGYRSYQRSQFYSRPDEDRVERSARFQRIAGWVVVAIGVVHLGVTFIDYDALTLRALWFVGSGFALLLIGGLNVITGSLAPQQFAEMRGLRFLTLASDGCGAALGILYIALTGGRMPQGPVLLVLFVLAGATQVSRRGPASTP